jgi:hypothetical protein
VESPQLRPSLRLRSLLADWSRLGTKLAARGHHRVAIALHAARAAASGGAQLTAHEEEQIAAWFAGIVDEAIRRGGSSGDDRDETAAAIWQVLSGDWHRDPVRVCPARCPAVAEAPAPGERGFLAAFRAAAAGYVHTAIAGASEDEIAELCALAVASDAELETYRPWGLVDAEDAPAAALLEPALASLTLRRPTNAELCSGFGGWAQGFALVTIEHTLSPVDRIGATAWLARVALRDEEQAA